MFARDRNKKKREGSGNSRINLIMAIIFLLGMSLVAKLYSLQVVNYDYYAARADSQHLVANVLEPERGRIFFQDDADGGNANLYPAATNKDFASLYAVPKEIKNSETIADRLYVFFKQDEVMREVEEFFQNEDGERLNEELSLVASYPEEERAVKEDEIRKRHEIIIGSEEYSAAKKIRKEDEIKKRKEEKVNEYLVVLNKKNDPYEPLEKKVEENVLKDFYISVLTDDKFFENRGGRDLKKENLIIKDDGIFYKNEAGEESAVIIDGIAFMMKLGRFYPERNFGSHIIGFVGYVENEERGRYGLEGFFDEELFGKAGSIKTEKGAGGDLIIINDREFVKPQNGSNIILTINKTIQYTACSKLNKSVLKHGADGGSLIVMDPFSGAILAMCSWPDYDPNDFKDVDNIKVYNNPAIFDQYEPGSIFKPLTMAVAVDLGKVAPDTTYTDNGFVMVDGWSKPIRNSDYETYGGHGETDMTAVLELSLNTGAIFAMEQATPDVFSRYVKDFGFGEKTGIELETESVGNISNLTSAKIKPIDAAVSSFGQGITATPIQMAAAYSALANGGILMKPYLVKEIINTDGTKTETRPVEIRRVISEKTSLILSGMMVNVVENGHSKRAAAKGYYVAGKTGTAQVASSVSKGYGSATIHTFVGFAPAESPKFVMLVKLDNPKDANFAESTSAPLFGEIAEFLLNYYQIPKERTDN